MKKLYILALAAGALLSLGACSTPDAAKTNADGTKTASTDGPKVVCSREASTGSLLAKRQCNEVPTEAERARMAADMQNIIRSTGSQPGGK
ncbi:hypothetical protein [Roseateles chitosanitabidus]|uniref:hypothetical protein n=1 Tax=Roseateles chitosanitabidus TaxID=65048 RepID=UPI0008375771|nr:hypothetical protein [Roseateles chitosanitabidus]MBO9684990.1 hypothetical protein [Roseateles chitosanitabidus]